MCEYVPDTGLRLAPMYDPLIIKGKTLPPTYSPTNELARISPSAPALAHMFKNTDDTCLGGTCLWKPLGTVSKAPTKVDVASADMTSQKLIITLLFLLLALLLAYIALIICARFFSLTKYLAEGCDAGEGNVAFCERRCFEHTQGMNPDWAGEQITGYCEDQCKEVRNCERIHQSRRFSMVAVIMLAVLAFLLLAAIAALLLRPE